MHVLRKSSQARGSGRKAAGRSGRQNGKTTVVSCRCCVITSVGSILIKIISVSIIIILYIRVFRKGVCKKTKSNIILVNKSISSKCPTYITSWFLGPIKRATQSWQLILKLPVNSLFDRLSYNSFIGYCTGLTLIKQWQFMLIWWMNCLI